jgi:hypothetical protein
MLYVRDRESSQEPSHSCDTPSSEGVLDAFWAKGPFMGYILSTGITAGRDLESRRKARGNSVDRKRAPSYIPSFKAKHSRTMR